MSATARLQIKTVSVLEEGCFSCLLWDNKPFAVSVERTFAAGEATHGKRIVVPNGIILARRTKYHRGGYETFELMISGHDRVLFHKGNTEDDSLACVIVAESFTELSGKVAIGDSKGGFNEFMQKTEGLQEFNVWVSGR